MRISRKKPLAPIDDNWLDRRTHRRFELPMLLRYKTLKGEQVTSEGTGMVKNLSSQGIFFTAEQPLPAGVRVELTIQWPARYAEIYPMELVVAGRTIRSGKAGTAVKIIRKRLQVGMVASVRSMVNSGTPIG